ncbi:MAG: hypothetical protein JW854_14880 [Actinobacteria bacterium]|nr:hypothetical protein [Actinomycetota bacterium]
MGEIIRKAAIPAIMVLVLAVTIPLQYLVRREVVVGIPSESVHSHASHEEEDEHDHVHSGEEEHEHEHTEEEGHLASDIPLGKNLFPNHGLEVGTREQIWGWTSFGPGQGEAVYRDDDVAYRGLASAAVSTNGITIEEAGWYMRLDELPLDHVVVFEGCVKAEALAGIAYLEVTLETREEGSGSAQVLDRAYSDTVAGDSDWTLRTVSIYVPPEATGVWVKVGLSGQGRAWFDDLTLMVEEPE